MDFPTFAGVNVVGYHHVTSGLGEAARRITRSLRAAGVEVRTVDVLTTDSPRQRDALPVPSELFEHTIAVVTAAELPAVWDSLPTVRSATSSLIGYWFWELSEIHATSRPAIELVDEIWTPTRFVSDAYTGCGRPVRHVPMQLSEPTVDRHMRMDLRARLGIDQRDTLFLNSVDLFSVIHRKNPLGAIDAFVQAFGDEPALGVRLVMKVLNGSVLPDDLRSIHEAASADARITIIDDHLSDEEHSGLIATADCLVSLHRGEGLGLQLAAAMWLGTVVIATRYGGHLDLMDDSSAALVDCDLVVVSDGRNAYSDDALWAEPRLHDAAVWMRRLHDDDLYRAELVRNARRRMELQPSSEEFGHLYRQQLFPTSAARTVPVRPAADSPLTVHVLATSQEAEAAFVDRHPHLAGSLQTHVGEVSPLAMIDELVKSEIQIACVVEDDATLPENFLERVGNFLSEAADAWPNWGAAANSGWSPVGVGFGASHVVRYDARPSGGPNNSARIVPASTMGGSVFLVNCAALRSSNVVLPRFSADDLVGVPLALEVLRAGLAVLIAPQLTCYREEYRSGQRFAHSSASTEFTGYLHRAVTNHTVATIDGTIDLLHPERLGSVDMRVDLDLAALRSARRGRHKRSLAIVTRTRFDRPELLARCLRSVESFRVAAKHVEISHVVISSRSHGSVDIGDAVEIIRVDTESLPDDRAALIASAVQRLESDHVWFLDDDDELFEDDAEMVALAVSQAPAGSPILVDSQRFVEDDAEPIGRDLRLFSDVRGERFFAADFLRSFSGVNHTPFCSIILDRSALADQPRDLFERVTLFEDLATVLHALIRPGVSPTTVPVLAAGISIRTHDPSQTVLTEDRTRWNHSLAELVTFLVDHQPSPLLSLPDVFLQHAPSELRNAIAELGELRTALGSAHDELRSTVDEYQGHLESIRAERNNTVDTLQGHIANIESERDTAVKALQSHLEETGNALDATRRDLTKALSELDQVNHATTWKATRPLRVIHKSVVRTSRRLRRRGT